MKLADEVGQSLLEVIVVIAVGVIIVGALVFATISSLRSANFAKNQTQATKLAQEGIERARLGRNRNSNITGFNLGGNSVDNWIDPDLWDFVKGSCNPCYFNIDDKGNLSHIGTVITNLVEKVPPEKPIFTRVINLSDENIRDLDGVEKYKKEKILSVEVSWIDFAGSHKSNLTTILRRL